MKQRYLFSFLICIFPFTAHANFNGFYAGANIGGLKTTAHIEENVIGNVIDQFGDNYTEVQKGSYIAESNSATGTLYLGYSKLFQGSFYSSLEVFLNAGNRNVAHDNDSTNTTISNVTIASYSYNEQLTTRTTISSNKLVYGADLKLGFPVTQNAILYARLGACFNQLKLESDNSIVYQDLPYGSSTLSSSNTSTAIIIKKKHVTGLRLGIGMEKKLTQHVGLTLDYIYTYYGKISGEGAETTQGTENNVPVSHLMVDGLSNTTEATLRDNSALIGIIYRF